MGRIESSPGPSIATRLIVLFSVSAFLTLGASTAVLYLAFVDDLEKDDIGLLQDKVRWLRIALRNATDYSDLVVHGVVEDPDAKPHGAVNLFYARVLTPSGEVLAETPGMEQHLPVDYFPAPVSPEKMAAQMRHQPSPDGKIYQVVAVQDTLPPQRIYQIGLDDTIEETLLERFRVTSLGLVLLGTLLFGVAGVIISHRALRPLREIAATAEQITAARLNDRVKVDSWPGELTAVAEAFNRMLTRLAESFDRLTGCSADLAHELRTPLHNVMGQTEVALSRDRTPSEYRDVLQSNLEELNRLARMTNGLLFLARADDPRTQIEPSTLDVRAELEAVRDFHDALSDAMEVEIVCEGSAQVVADPNLFRRAVTNLVSNSLRHSSRGTRITLSVESEFDAVTVSVRDEGCGIAPEHLPMVFDRFYRTGRRDLDRGDGTGLGLAIVRSIMTLHSGSAGIESKLGRGTTVRLRFPVRAPIAPLPQIHTHAPAPAPASHEERLAV